MATPIHNRPYGSTLTYQNIFAEIVLCLISRIVRCLISTVPPKDYLKISVSILHVWMRADFSSSQFRD